MVGKRNIERSGPGRSSSSCSGRPGRGDVTASPSRRTGPGGEGDEDVERGRVRGVSTSTSTSTGTGTGTGTRPRPKIWTFRDAARTALEDHRREELKKALLHDMDHTGLEKFRRGDDELKRMRNGQVRSFYETQNEKLNDWLEVDAVVMAIADDVLESMNPDPDQDGDWERHGGLHDVQGNVRELLPQDEQQNLAKAEWRAKWALKVNIIANMLLLAAKGAAALSSGSLSLIASLVDSALDLLCTLIIWSTNRLVQWRLRSLQVRFPVGRRRLEPSGILVFSIIMVISFLQILKESVEALLVMHGEAKELPAMAIGAMLATIIVKGLIGIGCIPIKTSSVQALVQDCKTDVIFNSLTLLFPFVGAKTNIWWLDAAGAGLLSLYIIYDWGATGFENVARLSGTAAPQRTMQKLMYMAYRFSPVLKGIKSITAYHAGDGIWAEFDILLEGETKLHRSHDIAETLQYCAEGLDEVDRAFVTTDYSSTGPPGHAQSMAERGE